MDILQKCQKWIQEEHFNKVIKALDGIEPNERTPEMDLQLALALTNQGARVKNGSHMIQRAIELLESHEQLLGKSFMWNFLMGNAHFLLNEEQLTVLKNMDKCVNIHLLRAHIRLGNLLNWYAVPQIRSDVGRLKVK